MPRHFCISLAADMPCVCARTPSSPWPWISVWIASFTDVSKEHLGVKRCCHRRRLTHDGVHKPTRTAPDRRASWCSTKDSSPCSMPSNCAARRAPSAYALAAPWKHARISRRRYWRAPRPWRAIPADAAADQRRVPGELFDLAALAEAATRARNLADPAGRRRLHREYSFFSAKADAEAARYVHLGATRTI